MRVRVVQRYHTTGYNSIETNLSGLDMLFRIILFPLMMMFLPRLARTAWLVWKLSFDNRVPFLLRLVVPATLLYFLTPLARIPVVGLVGYLPVLWLAISLLTNLAPRAVVAGHAPWMARQDDGDDRPPQDPSKVVEGRYQVKEDDEAEE